MNDEKEKSSYLQFVVISLLVIIILVCINAWLPSQKKEEPPKDPAKPIISTLDESNQPPKSSDIPPSAVIVDDAVEIITDEERTAAIEKATKAWQEANDKYEKEKNERERLLREAEHLEEENSRLILDLEFSNNMNETEKATIEQLTNDLDVTEKQLIDAKSQLKAKELPELNTSRLKERYESVAKLSTITYTYEAYTKADPEGRFLLRKEYIYKIPGKMELGVDISGIGDGIKVDDNKKIITIIIPRAFVISNEIIEFDSNGNLLVQRFDISSSWFNPVTDNDYINVVGTVKKEQEEYVKNKGMLIYAQELAGYRIKELLEPIAQISGYTIEIENK